LAKRSKKRSSSSSSQRKPRRTSRKSTAKSSPPRLPSLGLADRLSLSPERKRDLIALLVLALGLTTAISAISSGTGVLGTAWLRLLARIFGWGAFAVPIVLIVGGVLLLSRSFQWKLPELHPEAYLGLGILYAVALATFHALAGSASFEQGLAIAAQGRGGGVVGAVLHSVLVGALGGAGAAIALLALLLVGLSFTFRLSLADLLQRAIDRLRELRQQLEPTPEIGAGPASGLHSPAATSHSASSSPMMIEQQPMRQGWSLPSVEALLEVGSESKADDEFERKRAQLIEDTLKLFGAPAKVVAVNRGPTITQFGVEPEFLETRGGRRTKVKVSKVAALADDLALALAAPSIRIEAPVPGKGYVGIEVPNPEIALVSLRDVMSSPNFQQIDSNLRLGLGQDVSGQAVAADLASMPHLLIAGTTGSGKSVCVNAIVACLLLQNSPHELRLLMIDPKRVELTSYNGIPHLLVPVVVDLARVVPALQWVSKQMDDRYKRFSKEGVRNIADFNARMRAINQDTMPYIAVVIDELADLMMMAPDETERVVTRLAQLARATGIHLIIATQRPSVDVVTGIIKANFPARIAFAVASSVDSRVIIDQPGAERLLGRGDMLYQAADAGAPVRMQGSFVSESELDGLVGYWKQAALGAEDSVTVALPTSVPLKQAALWEEMTEEQPDRDQLFNEAVAVLREMRRGSISLLQRRLRIGYTRAARLIDQLEEAGVVGPAQTGSSAREVLDYGELAPPA
jgi:S-DNA-T family DNA segregation ATPase FtsK/SpoIIIE